jgi:hypothetical protein
MEAVLMFVVYALATYRAALMLAVERGPRDLFARLRYEVNRRWPVETDPRAFSYLDPSEIVGGRPTHWIAAGMKCVGCLSFWAGEVAGVIYVARSVWPGVWHIPFDAIACGLAVSAVAVLIETRRTRV